MLNQSAHDIYDAAMEQAEGIKLWESRPFLPSYSLLGLALECARQARGERRWQAFDVWLKAVNDLAAICRAERGAKEAE